MHPTLAAIPDAFAGGFGAATAVVLIGGGVLLRWQRNRLQFSLMQSAIERGVTPMPGAPPLWLVSLRQGVMILVLGIGLALAGWFAYRSAVSVPMPVITAPTQPSTFQGARQFRPFPPMGDQGPPDGQGPPDRPRPGGRPRPGMLPGAGPPGAGSPGDGPQGNGPPGDGPPRGPSPPLESWHRAQDEKAVATVAMGSGLILGLLGIVRVLFAFAERRYAGDTRAASA